MCLQDFFDEPIYVGDSFAGEGAYTRFKKLLSEKKIKNSQLARLHSESNITLTTI